MMQKKTVISLLVLLVSICLIFFVLNQQDEKSTSQPKPAVSPQKGIEAVTKSEQFKGSSKGDLKVKPDLSPTEVKDWIFQSIETLKLRFQETSNLGQRSSLLTALKKQLLAHPDRAAVKKALLDWILSEENFPTGLKFRPGKDGSLRSWNSGRIFALDILSQIDLEAASKLSWGILENNTSHPSETVLALKCIAQKEGTTITANPKWVGQLQGLFLKNQSKKSIDPSLLYGLDMFVFSNDPNQLSFLDQLHDSPKSLQHGAKIATKRLVQNKPSECFEYILKNPLIFSEQPQLKGSLFAYADPSDSLQRDKIEQFMADSNNKSESVIRFLNSFPNFDRGISYNLLTESKAASMKQAAKADQVALKMVKNWLEKNKHPAYKDEIIRLKNKLERFVKSAETGKKK